MNPYPQYPQGAPQMYYPSQPQPVVTTNPAYVFPPTTTQPTYQQQPATYNSYGIYSQTTQPTVAVQTNPVATSYPQNTTPFTPSSPGYYTSPNPSFAPGSNQIGGVPLVGSPFIQPALSTIPAIQPTLSTVPMVQPTLSTVPSLQSALSSILTLQPSLSTVPKIQPSLGTQQIVQSIIQQIQSPQQFTQPTLPTMQFSQPGQAAVGATQPTQQTYQPDPNSIHKLHRLPLYKQGEKPKLLAYSAMAAKSRLQTREYQSLFEAFLFGMTLRYQTETAPWTVFRLADSNINITTRMVVRTIRCEAFIEKRTHGVRSTQTSPICSTPCVSSMDPWSVSVKTPAPFTNTAVEFPMSDTIRLDSCNACLGRGEERCALCDNGRVRCTNCVGRGRYNMNNGKLTLCSICNATGRVQCRDCRGTGYKRCAVCHGNRRSFSYSTLEVKFMSDTRCKVCSQCPIPSEELNKSSGVASYKSKIDDLSIPPMITDPMEQSYWNELVEHRGEMTANDIKIHNYRMSVQEVPIVAGTVTLNNKTYNIWLSGNEAYCYAPELGPEFQTDFGHSQQEGVDFYAQSLMQMSMTGNYNDLLSIFQ